ncbi:MAG: hypothetical protein A3J48_02115 [Candidatus Doudnabacteria bacterium RIFCSPHIGHO2_02_FULL_46_11]|uniref:Uncharacterized protein n=1 Tax=Candidatus Doudnabacteria bacterium RIFCSPHIGHO2_02_FULL_46_11 TaxID=1817832 RepID=A0A1F5P4W8_9BACT|nr:MAG: hypothetical protein A3J48_02115 [Candidatus Doudnabacteria bacterium RIFCSPHIGHO2_02_FULL_46_11]
MSTLKNYLGQLRLYSFADTALLLWAFEFRGHEFAGGLLLWCAFLAYLEWRHNHGDRTPIPGWVVAMLTVAGLVMFPIISAATFLFLGMLYTLKKRGKWGLISPYLRGLQTAALISHHASPYWLFKVAMVMWARNVIGDARDVNRDRAEGVMTKPVIKNWYAPHWRTTHRGMVMVTSYLWWSMSTLSVWWVASAWVVQIITYNWTPRGQEATQEP